jgi:5'-nucleotidase
VPAGDDDVHLVIIVLGSMRVLLTNDDGIEAKGLQTLRRALLEVPGVELAVIAPDSNRSATARSITIRRPIWVKEVAFKDGTSGFATDGTPVDCVRFATLGLVEGFEADLIVSGINHGANLGDDITYSGTVAAALEGVVLGLPAIAVSQVSATDDWHGDETMDFTMAAAFVARIVDEIDEVPLPEGTLLNVNVPHGEVQGVEVARLGKRVYRDELSLEQEEDGRRLYRIYGPAPDNLEEEGTDQAAVARGRIAVTPLHFDLTDEPGIRTLGSYDLARLLAPAVKEVE